MTARFDRAWAKASRANLAASVDFLLVRPASQSASAALATPERRRGRMQDVCHLSAGEIPNVRAITNGLRRQKVSLST